MRRIVFYRIRFSLSLGANGEGFLVNHSTEKDTEAQRGEVAGLKSTRQKVGVLGLDPPVLLSNCPIFKSKSMTTYCSLSTSLIKYPLIEVYPLNYRKLSLHLSIHLSFPILGKNLPFVFVGHSMEGESLIGPFEALWHPMFNSHFYMCKVLYSF